MKTLGLFKDDLGIHGMYYSYNAIDLIDFD